MSARVRSRSRFSIRARMRCATRYRRCRQARMHPDISSSPSPAQGCFFVRHGLVAASFVLSGFVWGAMVPFTLNHKFEAMFYIPASLFFYSLVVRLARRAMDPRLASVLCFMWAAAIFGASNVEMSGVAGAAPPAGGGAVAQALRSFGGGRGAAEMQKAVVRDFDAVRAIMPRRRQGVRHDGTIGGGRYRVLGRAFGALLLSVRLRREPLRRRVRRRGGVPAGLRPVPRTRRFPVSS